MKRMTVVLFALVFSLFALMGCEPTIDATSTESFGESVEEISESLDDEDREYFEMYIGQMLMADIFQASFDHAFGDSAREDMDTDEVTDEILNRYHGMTASDVFAKAEEMERQEDDFEWPSPEEYNQHWEEVLEDE